MQSDKLHFPAECVPISFAIGPWSLLIGVQAMVRGRVRGHSMKEIRDMEAFHNSVRNIDVVELWSGCQSICNAARLGGYVARRFDKHRSPGVTDVPGEHNEDITTKPGLNKALGLVLGLRENGLLWMAPVCSSFCWLNLSNKQRSKENKYRGDTTSAVAKEGNKMALSAMLLAEVALEESQRATPGPPQNIINPNTHYNFCVFFWHLLFAFFVAFFCICCLRFFFVFAGLLEFCFACFCVYWRA